MHGGHWDATITDFRFSIDRRGLSASLGIEDSPTEFPPIGHLQNVPHSDRVFEMVPGRQVRKPLRTFESQAEY
jgi:hypothetical protein